MINNPEDHKELLEGYREWLVLKKYSSKTASSYCGTVRRFLSWIDAENVELMGVGYNDVLEYMKTLKTKGNKVRTQQTNGSTLRHLFDYLIDLEFVTENPASNLKFQGIKRKVLFEVFSSEELHKIYQSYSTEINVQRIITERGILRMPPQKMTELARKRNKIILGLLIYQGVSAAEVGNLELTDLQLREGKIKIHGGRRTAGRILKLEAFQIYDLMDYLAETRKAILEVTGKQTDKVFFSTGSSLNFPNLIAKLVESLQNLHPQLKNIQQIRSSVIVNWLRIYNLRKVQYLAGHRYVSSTEAYKVNDVDGLKQELSKYHPLS